MSNQQDFVIENGVLTQYNGPGGEVTLPDGISYINWNCFSGCTTLTSIVIPEGVTRLPGWTFNQCTALERVVLPASMTYLEAGTFRGCEQLARVEISQENPAYFCEDNLVRSKDGTTIILALAGLSGTAALPEDVTAIYLGAFQNCVNLTELILPGSIQTLYHLGFSDRSRLKTVVLREGIEKLDENVFQNCAALERVVLPASVTSIGKEVFAGCTKLASLEIDSENPRFVCADGLVYSKDGKTVEFALGGWSGPCRIPEGVRKIAWYAFTGCGKITEISIPDSVASIGTSAFSGCTALKTLKLPKKVKKLSQNLCNSCTALEEVQLPEALTEIGAYAFANCGLREVTLPEKVEKVGASAFAGCPMKKVVFTSQAVRFSTTAFGDNAGQVEYVPCQVPLTSLQKSVLDSVLHTFARRYLDQKEPVDPDLCGECLAYLKSHRRSLWKDREILPVLMKEQYISAKEFERCLEDVSKLNDLELTATLLEYRNRSISQEEIDQAAQQKLEKEMRELTREKPTAADLRKIWKTAKREDGSLEIVDYRGTESEVVVPDRIGRSVVTSIGIRAFSPAKVDLTPENRTARKSLSHVVFPETLTEIGGAAFEGCSQLTHLSIPVDVKEIGSNAFKDCRALADLTLPDSVARIGPDAFSGTAWLKNQPDGGIYFKNMLLLWKGEVQQAQVRDGTVSILPKAFANQKELTEVVLPQTLQSIGQAAFYGCVSLRRVILPERLRKLEENVFEKCSSLVQLEFPERLKTLSPHMCADCVSLTQVRLPAVKEIPYRAFTGCTKLERVFIPASVKKIVVWAFDRCPNLTICAPAGSYAEQYAQEHQIPFQAL